MADAAYRYAIYAAPAVGSAWWEAGSRWLGRDAASGAALPQPAVPGMPAGAFAALSADPRRYGWHATLKPPFRLAAGVAPQDLRAALQAFCARHPAAPLPPLRVRRLGSFLALCPAQEAPAAAALAAACVQDLHPLAAAPGPEELARHRAKTALSPEQDALLQRWGYPWVLQQFRLHFSLTGALHGTAEVDCARLQRAAESHFAALPPCPIDRLSLFAEPARGAAFQLLDQWVLAG